MTKLVKEIRDEKCHAHITTPSAYQAAAWRGLQQARNYLRVVMRDPHWISAWDRHRLRLLHGLLFGPLYSKDVGRFRRLGEQANFSGRVGADSQSIRQELDLLTQQIRGLHQALPPLAPDTGEGVLERFELVASYHARLVLVHPFGDGNGRVSRMLVFAMEQTLFPGLVRAEVCREIYMEGVKALPKNLALLVAWLAARQGLPMNSSLMWRPPFPLQVTHRPES